MKIPLSPFLFTFLTVLNTFAGPNDVTSSDRMTREEILSNPRGVVLQGEEVLSTPDTFKPPVEITIVAKTDSTNLRMGYAADQVIFNWEENKTQLRVDGGPADGQHKSGTGAIPIGQYVTIRWVVTPGHQSIFVNDELRYEHSGDYSGIDKGVSVFPAMGSKVTVKSIRVKLLKVPSLRAIEAIEK